MPTIAIASGADLSTIKSAPEPECELPVPEPEPRSTQPELPEPVNDPVVKRALIMECQQYRYHPQVGNKHLSGFDCGTRLETLTCTELENLRNEMRFVLGAKNGSAFWSGAFFAGVSGLEFAAVNFTPLRIQGLAYNLQRSEELKDILAELELKHAKFTYIEPEYRLMAVVAQTALAIHSTNSARETTQQILSEPVSVEAKEKFADL